jgi:hypothetical protein
MAKIKWNALISAGIGQPVIHMGGFYTDGNIRQEWLHLLLELAKVCSHITKEKDFTLLVHDTGIHLTGMKIDATDIFGINLRRSS